MDVILRNSSEIRGRLSGLKEIGGMGKKEFTSISMTRTKMSKTHNRLGSTSQKAPSSTPST